MPLRLSKIINNSKLNGVYYFYNGYICFDWDIHLEDLFEDHLVKISGAITNITLIPKLEWTLFNISDNNNYCPCLETYQASSPNISISHWLESTYIIVKPELLLKAWKLCVQKNVLYLVNDQKWDGYFCKRSYFTRCGNWTPSLVNPYPDKMIHLLEDEINFFMSLKKMIFFNEQFYKSKKKIGLSPEQIEFMLDNEVVLILQLIKKWNKDIWNEISLYLEPDSKIYQLWSLQILFFYPTKVKLMAHFLSFNKLNQLFPSS